MPLARYRGVGHPGALPRDVVAAGCLLALTARDYPPAVEHLIRVSDEVQTALAEERAVVALETTLVAHGFPAPTGVEVGLASEAAVRAAGAVPATIGVLDGRIVIGLTESELERFEPSARKLGPRDLAVCAVQGAVGATTVGGTLAAAQAVGIRFMGTGGLGGVHRGFPTPPDVSADLGACARIPALIVSSGVKSLLDVGATVELLETLGVPVLGYRVDTLPLFYAAEGGPPVSARVESADEAARVADAHWRLGGNAILVGRPPDESLDVGATDRGDRRRGARPGYRRPGRDAVRPRRPPRALGRRDPPRQPRPDRRQRRARRRDRGRLRRACEPLRRRPRPAARRRGLRPRRPRVRRRPEFTRKTTVVRLAGAGEEGLGEDVTYDGGGAGRAAGARAGPATRRRVDARDVLAPPRDAAALRARAGAARVRRLPPLGLRERRARPRAPAGGPLARRRPSGASRDPSRSSPPAGSATRRSTDAAPRLPRASTPRCASSSTHDPTGRTTIFAELQELGCVDSVDLKGQYRGTVVDNPPDPELYRRVIEAFPDAWLEDPALTPETRRCSSPVADRVTWDAVIHSVADIEALRWPPRTVNVKPSRFGTIERLFATYDYCEAQGIGAYGGGQWELSVGRDHIQLLAALFHPDTPNDVAPGGYNADRARRTGCPRARSP